MEETNQYLDFVGILVLLLKRFYKGQVSYLTSFSV